MPVFAIIMQAYLKYWQSFRFNFSQQSGTHSDEDGYEYDCDYALYHKKRSKHQQPSHMSTICCIEIIPYCLWAVFMSVSALCMCEHWLSEVHLTGAHLLTLPFYIRIYIRIGYIVSFDFITILNFILIFLSFLSAFYSAFFSFQSRIPLLTLCLFADFSPVLFIKIVVTLNLILWIWLYVACTWLLSSWLNVYAYWILSPKHKNIKYKVRAAYTQYKCMRGPHI